MLEVIAALNLHKDFFSVYMDEEYEIVEAPKNLSPIEYIDVEWDTPPSSPKNIEEEKKLQELSIAINLALSPPKIDTIFALKEPTKIESIVAPKKNRRVLTAF